MITDGKCYACGAELTTADVKGLCTQCRNTGFDLLPTELQTPSVFPPFVPPTPPYTPPAQYGWVCPRCGAVHAPFIPHCHCTPPTKTTDSTQMKINFDDE